ncbi:hypothetical protein, partial [Sphingobacterium daejeonense]|uniref:hypothetical protein n=1 Tax=Sphingobacterium daejeonense TaxID=371142 RepID=UPI003D31BA68
EMCIRDRLYTDKHTLKATVFSGKEKTYQAWYGLAEPLFTGNKDRIEEYADNLWLFDAERETVSYTHLEPTRPSHISRMARGAHLFIGDHPSADLLGKRKG